MYLILTLIMSYSLLLLCTAIQKYFQDPNPPRNMCVFVCVGGAGDWPVTG
jgi:hypothetical protein